MEAECLINVNGAGLGKGISSTCLRKTLSGSSLHWCLGIKRSPGEAGTRCRSSGVCHFAPSLQRAGSQPRDCQCWGHPPGTCKGAGGALRLCAREHRGHASSRWSHEAQGRVQASQPHSRRANSWLPPLGTHSQAATAGKCPSLAFLGQRTGLSRVLFLRALKPGCNQSPWL